LNNRIIRKGWRSNFIKKSLDGGWLKYNYVYVVFEDIEEKTIQRLLAIGYSPAIAITPDDKYYYKYGGLEPWSTIESKIPDAKINAYYVHDYSKFPAIITC
jgi:hypothetical protein